MTKHTFVSVVGFALLSMVPVLLVTAMQIPILQAGGSDSLERIITVAPLAQWLALGLLLLSGFLCFVLPSIKRSLSVTVKSGVMLFAVCIFLLSGHNFRYSGRQHALIDSWFFIPVQTVAINPTTVIDNARLKRSPLFITAYGGDNNEGDNALLTIFLGVPPFNLNKRAVERVLIDLGFESLPI